MWTTGFCAANVDSVDKLHKLSTAVSTGAASHAADVILHTNTTNRLILMFMKRRVFSY